MSKSATESKIRELNRQLEAEKRSHARTRNELQQEITRIWRLVPSHYINLMGAYPSLRRLLHVLAEAADLQDPSRSSPVEDTMRVDFVHSGHNASSSQTESAVLTHRQARARTKILRDELDDLQRFFQKRLADKTHHLGQLVPGSEWEYDERPVCWRKPCPKRGRKQPLEALVANECEGCGRSFR